VISREEFDRLKEEYMEFATSVSEKDRHERGGTTLGELAESGELAQAVIDMANDSEYQKRRVRRKLWYLLGNPENEYANGSLGDYFGVAINDLDDEDPVEIGIFAARHYKERKFQNRLKSLRDYADLCKTLADVFEDRLNEETKIRRIQ
jgi:hypothetical protein